MSLKPLPHEPLDTSEKKKKTKKHFNPAVANHSAGDSTLKSIASRLVRFINRGSKYTIDQIDELIMSLQRSILKLQKEKHQLMQKKADRKQKQKRK